MESTRYFASIGMPALLTCAILGCSSSGEISEPSTGLASNTPAAAEDGETAMTPEEFVAEQGQSVSAAPDPANDVICRRQKTVGSHFAKTVCISREEKRKEDEKAREFMKSFPNRSVVGASN